PGRRRLAAAGARAAAARRVPDAVPAGRVAAHLRCGRIRPLAGGVRNPPPRQQELEQALHVMLAAARQELMLREPPGAVPTLALHPSRHRFYTCIESKFAAAV